MIAIKRSFALVLCLGLLAGSCDVMAESYKARQIDECREYVNLREDPAGGKAPPAFTYRLNEIHCLQ